MLLTTDLQKRLIQPTPSVVAPFLWLIICGSGLGPSRSTMAPMWLALSLSVSEG